MAPPGHPSRQLLKKRGVCPKTANEKIQLRITVAKRTGRLDLASDAVKRTIVEGNDSNSVSDVSSTGASLQIIDRIPIQPNDNDEIFLTAMDDNKESITSEKRIGILSLNHNFFFCH